MNGTSAFHSTIPFKKNIKLRCKALRCKALIGTTYYIISHVPYDVKESQKKILHTNTMNKLHKIQYVPNAATVPIRLAYIKIIQKS